MGVESLHYIQKRELVASPVRERTKHSSETNVIVKNLTSKMARLTRRFRRI